MHLKGPKIFELQFPCREWVQPVSSFRVRNGTEGFIKFSNVYGYSNTHIKYLRRAGLSSAYAGNLIFAFTKWPTTASAKLPTTESVEMATRDIFLWWSFTNRRCEDNAANESHPGKDFVWITRPRNWPVFSIYGSMIFPANSKSPFDKAPSGSRIAIPLTSSISTDSTFPDSLNIFA